MSTGHPYESDAPPPLSHVRGEVTPRAALAIEADVAWLRATVAVMRELGVVQADGIILGPDPTKLEKLELQAKQGDPKVNLEELANERRRQALAEARQEIRDKVGNDALTDEECDRFLEPPK